jgi:hypothetical protein
MRDNQFFSSLEMTLKIHFFSELRSVKFLLVKI